MNPPYPPSYGLNSFTVLLGMTLALNTLDKYPDSSERLSTNVGVKNSLSQDIVMELRIIQWKKNALRVSVAGRENISSILLAHTVTIWICTRLQHVIAAENSTACEDHESTRRAGANNVILLPENVNRMMGLWIRFTPTVFTSPLLTISVLETFFASQEFSGPRVIR